ncbi:serine hydrolase, partial [Vibrio parahaemolyticus]
NFASGNLFSTIDDMARYANALLARSFVSPNAYQTMWYQRYDTTDGKPDTWAYGWNDAKPRTGQAPVKKVTMNGGLPGIASNIILYPENGVA